MSAKNHTGLEINTAEILVPEHKTAIRQIVVSGIIDAALVAGATLAAAFHAEAGVIVASLPPSFQFLAPAIMLGLGALSAWLKKKANSNTQSATVKALAIPVSESNPSDSGIPELYRRK